MPILNETQAIARVNKIIAQSGMGPEYRVYQVQAAPWGWVMHWMPKDPSKVLYGSSPYLCHKNGYVRDHNEIAHRNNLMSNDVKGVVHAFIAEAEKRAVK